MPSELKRLMEKELAERYPRAMDCIVVGYTKLTGHEMTDLRRTLRERNIRMAVVKNSMAARVFAANGIGEAGKLLQGPSTLVTGQVEFPEMCKIIADCAREYREKLLIRGGLMCNKVLDARAVAQLASIPPLPIVHAQIVSGFRAPIVGVAYAFQSLLQGLACALAGIRKQKERETPPSAP